LKYDAIREVFPHCLKEVGVMGFGLRVPGLRVSTRGVRVGPRMANVRVSSRGRVSGSVGPRIARVSASSRGVRVGTGIGPVSVSGGRGGVRVGGGIGPVFGSVGRGGVSVGVGAGPLWASTGVGTRRAGSSSGRKEGLGVSSSKMSMAKQYESYRTEIAHAGSTRRSRDEMQIAGINALFSQVGYLIAPFENFQVPHLNLPSEDQLKAWSINRALQMLVNSGELESPLLPVSEVETIESVHQDAVSTLASRGISRPVHPATTLGIYRDGMPSPDEMTNWAYSEIRKTLSPAARLFGREKIRRQIEELAKTASLQLGGQIQEWELSLREYLLSLTIEAQNLVAHRNAERQKQLDEQSVIRKRISEVSLEIHKAQASASEYARAIYKRFLEGDSIITTVVLQTLLSDNAGTAAPIGIDDGDLLILMTAPSLADSIWPEKIDFSNDGFHLTAKKKTKDQSSNDYYIFLLSHAIAAARESFATSPHIKQVRLLMVDSKDDQKDLFERKTLALLEISRSELAKIPADLLQSEQGQAVFRAVNFWQESLASGDSYLVLSAVEQLKSNGIGVVASFLGTLLDHLADVESCYKSFVNTAFSKRPRILDLTEASVNTSDAIQIVVDEDMNSFEGLDVPVEFVQTPDYWIFTGFLVEAWNDDEVDVEKMKSEASELASVLYQFEESEIVWSTNSRED
jgi:hypothetical protein